MNTYLNLLFLILLSIGNLFSYSHLYLSLPSNQEPSSQNTFATDMLNFHSPHCNNPNLAKVVDLSLLQSMNPSVITQICNSLSNQELFECYHRYSNQGYLNYIRKQPGYEDFILAFHKKIHADYYFRKSLRHMPGFEGEKGFLKLIDNEAARITQERNIRIIQTQEAEARKQKQQEAALIATRNARCLDLDDRSSLSKIANIAQERSTIAQAQRNDILAARYRKRFFAAKETINNHGCKYEYRAMITPHQPFTDTDADVFNHCYGSSLDRQLHQELCDTRVTAMNLQSRYHNSLHLQLITPAIYRITAMAKKERNAEAAFNLSDFSHDLTIVASYCIDISLKAASAIGRGAFSGVKNVINPERWKDMMTGMLHLGAFFFDEVSRQEGVDHAFASLNHDEFRKRSEENYHFSKAQLEALSLQAHQTINKLRAMPWDQLLEKGVELGATVVLDTLALQALGNFAGQAGKTLVNNLADAMGSSAAKEYVVEVAGIRKIAIEEGKEATYKVIEFIKENPKLSIAEGKTLAQVTQEMDKLLNAGNMLDKGVLTAAGRSLQKKGSRPNSEFPIATGNTASINSQGEAILKEILTNPNITSSIRHHARFGDILECKIPGGRGVRFSSDGKTFIGFIEP